MEQLEQQKAEQQAKALEFQSNKQQKLWKAVKMANSKSEGKWTIADYKSMIQYYRKKDSTTGKPTQCQKLGTTKQALVVQWSEVKLNSVQPISELVLDDVVMEGAVDDIVVPQTEQVEGEPQGTESQSITLLHNKRQSNRYKMYL